MRSVLARLMLVVFVALLPALGFTLYTEASSRRLRQELVQDEALRLVRLVNAQLEQAIEAAHQVLSVIGHSPAVQDNVSDACRRLLAGVIDGLPRYVSAAIIGVDGHPTCAPGMKLRDVDVADRNYFRLAMQTGGFVIGDYTEGRVTRQPTIHMAEPFKGADGKIAGIVVLALDIGWLQHNLEQLALPDGAMARVSDRNGTILARIPNGAGLIGTKIPEASRISLQGTEAAVAPIVGADGTLRMVGYSPIAEEPEGLGVAVGLDPNQAIALFRLANRTGLLLLVGGLLLALALTALVGTRLIRHPVVTLLSAARRWQSGDLAGRTGLRHDRSEFGGLAAAFDAMASTLESRELTLRESEERLRLAVVTARLGIRELDLTTGKAYSSPEAAEIFGRDEYRDASFDRWFANVHPDDQASVRDSWDRSLANPGRDVEHEYRFRRPDGSWRWIAAHGHLSFENGRAVRPSA